MSQINAFNVQALLRYCDYQFQMWTKVLRSKVEHEKSCKGKRHSEGRKRDVMAESSAESQTTSSTSTSYVPPWFDRYVEYKFNLLDRAGHVSQTHRKHHRSRSSYVLYSVLTRFYRATQCMQHRFCPAVRHSFVHGAAIIGLCNTVL